MKSELGNLRGKKVVSVKKTDMGWELYFEGVKTKLLTSGSPISIVHHFAFFHGVQFDNCALFEFEMLDKNA